MLILMTSGQVIFLPTPIISICENMFLPITFVPGVIDEWTWHQYVCPITPNRTIRNMTYLLWSDLTPDLRLNFDVDFLRSNWVSFEPSWRKEHNCGKMDYLDIGYKLLEKTLCAENWCLTRVNFDLWNKNRWPKITSEVMFQIGRFVAHLLLIAACRYLS